jgi:integrase/recombinase XerD
MKKRMRMTMKIEKTFKDRCEDYLLDCKARNLREGTLKHYTDVIKQLYKYIPADTPIAEINSETFKNFIIELRNRDDINSQSLNTYARDLKTILYYFMRQEYIPTVKLDVPRVDKTPVETYTDAELMKLLKIPKPVEPQERIYYDLRIRKVQYKRNKTRY